MLGIDSRILQKRIEFSTRVKGFVFARSSINHEKRLCWGSTVATPKPLGGSNYVWIVYGVFVHFSIGFRIWINDYGTWCAD